MKTITCQHANHKDGCYGDAIYKKVTNEKRLKLLSLVREESVSLKVAAKMLEINYSTAKTILRVFRLENRILKKSAHKRKPRRTQSQSVESSNNETTYISNDLYKETEQFLDQFKLAIGTLQDCISGIYNNELTINNIVEVLHKSD